MKIATLSSFCIFLTQLSYSAQALTILNESKTTISCWIYRQADVETPVKQINVEPEKKVNIDINDLGTSFGVKFSADEVINSYLGPSDSNTINKTPGEEGLIKDVTNNDKFTIWQLSAGGLYVEKR